jgi:hypothetical protein
MDALLFVVRIAISLIFAVAGFTRLIGKVS